MRFTCTLIGQQKTDIGTVSVDGCDTCINPDIAVFRNITVIRDRHIIIFIIVICFIGGYTFTAFFADQAIHKTILQCSEPVVLFTEKIAFCNYIYPVWYIG